MTKQARATIKRRRIGSLLRQYREASNPKILSKDAARHLDADPVLLGRIERGEYRVKPDQVTRLLGLYGVTDPVVHQELRAAAVEPVDAGWWYPYRNKLSPGMLDFVTLEHEASEIMSVLPSRVDGLLQSQAYAQEIQETAVADSVREDADFYVAVRMARQQALHRKKNPVHLRCIMSEAALHSESPSIEGQIAHLIAMSIQDNVTLQVMPLNVPVGSVVDVQSYLLKFPKPWQDTVYSTTLGSLELSTDDSLARKFEKYFAALEEAALPVDRTREFLEERLRKIRNEH